MNPVPVFPRIVAFILALATVYLWQWTMRENTDIAQNLPLTLTMLSATGMTLMFAFVNVNKNPIWIKPLGVSVSGFIFGICWLQQVHGAEDIFYKIVQGTLVILAMLLLLTPNRHFAKK